MATKHFTAITRLANRFDNTIAQAKEFEYDSLSDEQLAKESDSMLKNYLDNKLLSQGRYDRFVEYRKSHPGAPSANHRSGPMQDSKASVQDDLLKMAFDYENFVSAVPPKLIEGTPQLGKALVYLGEIFELPDSVSVLGKSMMAGEPVSRKDAENVVRELDSLFYQVDFIADQKDHIVEFGAIKDRLRALVEKGKI